MKYTENAINKLLVLNTFGFDQTASMYDISDRYAEEAFYRCGGYPKRKDSHVLTNKKCVYCIFWTKADIYDGEFDIELQDVLYVGKTINLYMRLRQHLHENHQRNRRSKIFDYFWKSDGDVEPYIIFKYCDNNEEIKQKLIDLFRPKFNRMLKL